MLISHHHAYHLETHVFFLSLELLEILCHVRPIEKYQKMNINKFSHWVIISTCQKAMSHEVRSFPSTHPSPRQQEYSAEAYGKIHNTIENDTICTSGNIPLCHNYMKTKNRTGCGISTNPLCCGHRHEAGLTRNIFKTV